MAETINQKVDPDIRLFAGVFLNRTTITTHRPNSHNKPWAATPCPRPLQVVTWQPHRARASTLAHMSVKRVIVLHCIQPQFEVRRPYTVTKIWVIFGHSVKRPGDIDLQWRRNQLKSGTAQQRAPPLPSPAAKRPPSTQLGGLGERCKLPQWGLGRSPRKFRIWCIKASGGINFNEFPEKLLTKFINHKCNMQSVAKKWDGKMHYEPSHF